MTEGGLGGEAKKATEAAGTDAGCAQSDNRGWWNKLMESSSSMKRVLLQGAKYDAAPLLKALERVFGAWCQGTTKAVG